MNDPGEAIGFYDLRFERISLHSESEILDLDQKDLKDYPGLTDVPVLARGGGEHMEIFDSHDRGVLPGAGTDLFDGDRA